MLVLLEGLAPHMGGSGAMSSSQGHGGPMQVHPMKSDLADRLEKALNEVDPFAPDTPNLNAWPQPAVRREFAEWLAARVEASDGP